MTPPLQDANQTDPIFSERYHGKIGGKMRGKMLFFVLFFLSGGIAFMALSAPDLAQAQMVTPYPGVSATATAAAQNMSTAQSAKDAAAQHAAQQAQQAAQAAAAAQRSAQQAQQAAQAQAAANDAFSAAQAAAAEAQAALMAQQIGAASEALGRAEEAINNGKAQLAIIAGIAGSQKQTIDTLFAQLQKSQSDLQALQAANQAMLQSNQSLQAQNAELKSRFTISPTIAIMAGGFLLLIAAGFVAWKWSQHKDDPPEARPVPAGYEINQAEVIDQEQEDGKNA